MGTRSLTHVLDDHTESVLVTIYRQFDGYPSGHGADLAEILKDRTVVNGIGSNTPAKASNGAGCLAATIVTLLKGEEIGGIYLEPPGTEDHGEEYVYTVKPPANPGEPIRLKVESTYGYPTTTRETLFEGDVNDFNPNGYEGEG